MVELKEKESLKSDLTAFEKGYFSKNVSGKVIDITDAIFSKPQNLVLCGDSTQETRSGINQLMPFAEGETSYFSTLTQLEDSSTFYYKATPLADNWLKVECDRTGETVTADRYINFSVLSDKLPNLKTSTPYTIIVEFRNINITQAKGYLYLGNTSEKDKDDFFESDVAINLNSIQNNLVKQLLITNDSFEGQSIALRNFHTVKSKDKFSYEMRLSIVEGDYTDKDYVYEDFGVMPSPDYPSEILSVTSPVSVKSTGKNFLQMSNNTFVTDGRTYSIGNGSYKVTGTSTSENTNNLISGTRSGKYVETTTITSENSIYLKKSEYMFSCDRVSRTQPVIYFLMGNLGDTWSSGSNSYIDGNKTKKKIIVENDCYITISIYDYSTAGAEIEITNIQIEKGTETTNYEDYQENITSIPLLHELRSLPNGTHDRIYKKNGVWYDEQNIGQVVLNGSDDEKIGYNATYTSFYTTLLSNSIKKPANNNEISVIANHFKGETAKNCVNSDYNYCTGCNTIGTVWFRYNELTTVDEFKTWLSTHNTEVIYELAESIITEITDKDAIKSLNEFELLTGINYITSDAILNLEYFSDVSFEYSKLEAKLYD